MLFRVFFLVIFFLLSVNANDQYIGRLEKDRTDKEGIVFVSWNLCNFGCSKEHQEILFMADVLRNADIVAIQEVSTSNCGAQTTAKLADWLNRKGAKWDYIVTESTHESDSKERYAFLWKTKRIKLVKRNNLLLSNLSNVMEREPALVEFKVDGKSVFIGTCHLVPTKKKPELELVHIGESRDIKKKKNLIFAGDFNLGYKKLKPIFCDFMGLKLHIKNKTSLKRKYSEKKEYLYKGYDNIATQGINIKRSGIIDFVKELEIQGSIYYMPFEQRLTEARKVSDHLPVFIEFSL